MRARRPGCAGKFTLCWRAQHAPRCRIIFGLVASEYATCIIMAHAHDGCALHNSSLPRLNRIKVRPCAPSARLPNFRLPHVTRCRSRFTSPSSSILSTLYCLLSRRCAACCCALCTLCLCFHAQSCISCVYAVSSLFSSCTVCVLRCSLLLLYFSFRK